MHTRMRACTYAYAHTYTRQHLQDVYAHKEAAEPVVEGQARTRLLHRPRTDLQSAGLLQLAAQPCEGVAITSLARSQCSERARVAMHEFNVEPRTARTHAPMYAHTGLRVLPVAHMLDD